MKIKELIKRLEAFDQELEVAILDGFNGGGEPRTINLGPSEFDPAKHPHCPVDYADIESQDGDKIVWMGYGCY